MCIEQFGQKCTVDSFVAGYGAGKVPDPAYAGGYKSVVRARGFLCEVRQDCQDLWPSSGFEDLVLDQPD